MRMNPKIILGLALMFAVCSTATVWAGLSPEEVAKLGKELTPLGAEQGPNELGNIPEWTGGITEFPPGYEPGKHYVDPYADESPMFTITAANVDKYADKLSPGQVALIKAYPDTYKMNIYPTHRSAALPQRIYDMTIEIAAAAQLAEGGAAQGLGRQLDSAGAGFYTGLGIGRVAGAGDDPGASLAGPLDGVMPNPASAAMAGTIFADAARAARDHRDLALQRERGFHAATRSRHRRET